MMNPLPMQPMRQSKRAGSGEWMFKSILVKSKILILKSETDSKTEILNSKRFELG
jgi:hypothetical protein|tara:strand:- start:373 stop:537 length:165 start_codon:yes stop_codon:yes gene_type:complete